MSNAEEKIKAISVLEFERVMWSECCKEAGRDNVMRIYRSKNKLSVWSLDKQNMLPHEPWGGLLEKLSCILAKAKNKIKSIMFFWFHGLKEEEIWSLQVICYLSHSNSLRYGVRNDWQSFNIYYLKKKIRIHWCQNKASEQNTKESEERKKIKQDPWIPLKEFALSPKHL